MQPSEHVNVSCSLEVTAQDFGCAPVVSVFVVVVKLLHAQRKNTD